MSVKCKKSYRQGFLFAVLLTVSFVCGVAATYQNFNQITYFLNDVYLSDTTNITVRARIENRLNYTNAPAASNSVGTIYDYSVDTEGPAGNETNWFYVYFTNGAGTGAGVWCRVECSNDWP